jgi:hypothetical protein
MYQIAAPTAQIASAILISCTAHLTSAPRAPKDAPAAHY